MFEALTTGFMLDLATFKDVLDAHDCARVNYEQPPATPDPWATVRGNNLRRTTWHIYDHCAAFTRLYAIYATYIDDLIEEYLDILPKLYATYNLLPESVSTQHRVGLATILGKIGDDGTYQQLSEQEIITTLSHGITGGTPYKLLTKAFLTERSNYRLDVIGKILGTLGVDNAAKQISQNGSVKSFLATTNPDTTVHGELEQFIKRRNEAAHSHVTETVGTDEIKSTADFIGHVGQAVANLLSDTMVARQYVLGQLPKLGTVEQVAYGGRVVITHLNGCMIRPGDRFALAYDESVMLATVVELQLDGVTKDELLLTSPTEVGIKFDRKIKRGATICALQDQQTAPYQILRTFELRKDDISTAVSDKFRTLTIVGENGTQLVLEGIERVEIDAPQLVTVTEKYADLLIRTHLTFTAAIADHEGPPVEGDESPIEQSALDEITRKISILAVCKLKFPGLIAEPDAATIEIVGVNDQDPLIDPTLTEEEQ